MVVVQGTNVSIDLVYILFLYRNKISQINNINTLFLRHFKPWRTILRRPSSSALFPSLFLPNLTYNRHQIYILVRWYVYCMTHWSLVPLPVFAHMLNYSHLKLTFIFYLYCKCQSWLALASWIIYVPFPKFSKSLLSNLQISHHTFDIWFWNQNQDRTKISGLMTYSIFLYNSTWTPSEFLL